MTIFGLGAPGKCGYHPPIEYQRIFDLPSTDQQEAEFKKLPPARQVAMFRYAMYTEPPRYTFVDYLASGGQAVIPDLLASLEQEADDGMRVEFLRVFRQIHRKYYDLSNRPEVIERLKLESAKIRDSEYKKQSEEYIDAICAQK
jgi:hypothetical protein